MKNLLKFQLRKLFTNIYTYIFLAIQVVILLILAIVKKTVPDLAPESITGNTYMLTSLNQGFTMFALAIFISIFACEDRNNNVVKNIYARGYTATQTLFSEFIAVCLFTTISCCVNWLSSFAIGSGLFGTESASAALIFGLLAAQFLIAIAYTGLFYMVSRLIVKPAAVIAVNILAAPALGLLFTGLDNLLAKSGLLLSPYSLDGLLKSVSYITATTSAIGIGIALAIVYAAIFTLISVLVSKKRPA